MDQKLFCERVIGVSAGALCGYNYVAGEDGRTCYLNTKYCDDWRYLSMKSFVRTGNACGRESAFDDPQPPGAVRLRRRFDQSPMQLIAAFPATSSPARRLPPSPTRWPTCPYLIASSSMPLVSQIVDVDGKALLLTAAPATAPIMY